MPRGFPWHRFYAGEFRTQTAHLSPMEVGALIRILCDLWESDDCSIALDHRRLRMRTGVRPNKWDQTWGAIESLLDIEGDRITNIELREEHTRLKIAYVVTQDHGRIGGQTTAGRAHGYYANLRNQRNPNRSPYGNTIAGQTPNKSNEPPRRVAQGSSKHKNRTVNNSGSPPDLPDGSVGSPKELPVRTIDDALEGLKAAREERA